MVIKYFTYLWLHSLESAGLDPQYSGGKWCEVWTISLYRLRVRKVAYQASIGMHRDKL